MARSNTNAELFKALSQFGRMATSTATFDMEVSATSSVGASTFTVATSTIASTGSYVQIGVSGSYDVGKIEALSTADTGFTLHSKAAYIHSTGEHAIALSRTNLGDLDDNGVQHDVAADRTRIDAATKRHGYDHNINHTEYKVTVALENLSVDNVAAALGIPDAGVTGAGSTADPYVTDMTPDDFDTISPVHFWARGTMGNGNTVEIQWWDCRIDPSKSVQLARGQDAPMSFSFNAQHFRWLNPV